MFYIVITEASYSENGSTVEIFEKLNDAKKVANEYRKAGKNVRTLIKEKRICIYAKNKLI